MYININRTEHGANKVIGTKRLTFIHSSYRKYVKTKIVKKYECNSLHNRVNLVYAWGTKMPVGEVYIHLAYGDDLDLDFTI